MKRNFTKRLRLALICLICFSLLSACAVTGQKTAPPDDPSLSEASGAAETAGSYRYENMVNLQSNDIENTPPEYSGDAFDENTLANLNALMMPADAAPSTGVIVDVTQMPSFGAMINGVYDDTLAFLDAIDLAGEYDTVYAPQLSREYVITDTLEIDKNIHINFAGVLKYTGPKDRAVITTENLLRCNISIFYIRDSGGIYGNSEYWGGYHGYQNDDYAGIVMTNSKWTNVNINGVYNFNSGVVCRAAGGNGFWFNSINIKGISGCLNGLELRSDGNNSWINSNVFYDTSHTIRSEMGFLTNGHDYRSVVQTLINGNNYGGDSNIFYNFRFEVASQLPSGTTYTAIYLRKAKYWSFMNYRIEFLNGIKKFCVIDFGDVESFSHRSAATCGITFMPVAVPGTADYHISHQVEIINAPFLMCPIDEIYSFSYDKQYLAGQDLNLRSKYLRISNTKYALKGYSFLSDSPVKNTEVLYGTYNENVQSFQNTYQDTVGIDNEIYISLGVELSLTIENPKLHSTIVVQPYGSAVQQFKSDGTPFDARPTFSVSCFKADGSSFTSGVDSKGVKLLAMDGYFSTAGECFYPNTENSRLAFSVLSDEVATVAIGLLRSISGYSIFSTDKDARILRYRTASELNNYDQFFAAAAPTSTEGLFGTIVYDKDDPTTCWQLAKVNNQLAWVAQ